MSLLEELVIDVEQFIRFGWQQWREKAFDQALNGAEMRALMTLARRAPASTSELAKRLGVGLSATSRVLTRLTDLDFIARSSAVSDRRRHLWILTERGQTLVAQLKQQRRDVWQQRLAVLSTDEQRQFQDLLRRLMQPDHQGSEVRNLKSPKTGPCPGC